MEQEKLLFNELFQQKIWTFYHKNKRDFVWRQDITPYKIFVSEIMLQQTQTSRVVIKFEEWIKKFPNFKSVAQASTHEILGMWQGLGYNRRGLALHASAQKVVREFNGQLPRDPQILQTFSGIGSNTAGSICAFAFNLPIIFIETNIRTVFLYEFFQGQLNISDQQLLPLIQASIDHQNPREWYYALMDYGAYLKKELKVSNAASKHYTRQSKFTGSRRQVRGAIVRILTKYKRLKKEDLVCLVQQDLPENIWDIELILKQLMLENVIQCSQSGCWL